LAVRAAKHQAAGFGSPLLFVVSRAGLFGGHDFGHTYFTAIAAAKRHKNGHCCRRSRGLLKGIPAGAWVAISERQNTVLAYGNDAQTVLTEAEGEGEAHPLIVRVPEQETSLFL